MPIKVFSSLQPGAPTVNGTTASLITALDAVLVNGFNSVNVTSITRASTTATVTTSGAHGFATGDVALIALALQAEYNGEFVVTVTSSTTFTYDVTGSPVSPATTGSTITCKRAPAGFAKAYTGTSKGVYRSNDVTGLRHYFRVIDDGATSGGVREARLTGYVTMSDVDTGTDIFPTSGQYTNGCYWNKSDALDSTGRHWVCVTDGKTVYWFAYVGTTTASGDITVPSSAISVIAFGDFIPFKPGDVYASFTCGGSTASQFSGIMYSGLFNAAVAITNATASVSVPLIAMARDFTAVSGARVGQIFASALSSTLGTTAAISYPHQVDNGFYMTPANIAQGSPSVLRGRMPGLFEPLHGVCFPNMTIIDTIVGYSGRKFMMLHGKSANNVGACLIDITGPWDS